MQILKCACHLINRDSSGKKGQIEGLITIQKKKKNIMKEKQGGNENKEREGERKRNTDKMAARIFLANSDIKSFTKANSPFKTEF